MKYYTLDGNEIDRTVNNWKASLEQCIRSAVM